MWIARRALIVLVLLACLPMGTPRAEEPEEDGTYAPMPFLVRDTGAARFAVAEARRLLAAGHPRRALRQAQRVLDEMRDDFYLVSVDETSARWRLAAAEARDLLANLDSEEREAYERIAGPSAAPLLERGVRRRDPALLQEVVERFGASRAGVRAARLLAERAVEGAAWHDAVHWAREGARFAPQDAGLLTRLVDALGAAGRRGDLEALTLPSGEAGGAEVEARREAWIARLEADPSGAAPPALWGGAPDRTAPPVEDAPPVERLRWRRSVPFVERTLDYEAVSPFGADGQGRFHQAWSRLRPLHPVARDRVLHVATGRSVMALDLYSGQPIWVFDEAATRDLDLVPPEAYGEGRTSLDRTYSPVVTDDLVIASVEVRRPYAREMLNTVEISTYLPRRVLVALDRRTGRLRWHMHGDDAASVDVLQEASIVSPCVVAQDLVVAVASRYRQNHRVSVVAFDLGTGALRWHRPLGWGQQELNLFGAPVKELAVAPPAVADDTVYVTSGLGFAGAVELRTGRPRWLASYEILPIEPVQFWFRAPLRHPVVAPAPVMVLDDVLLVAPADGQHVHAFDRHDGTLRWRRRYPRPATFGATSQVIGVAHDGRRDVLLLVGQQLEAWDARTGELAWRGLLQDEPGHQNVPVGQGAVTQDAVLVPTDRGLVRFDLAREGSFLGRTPWPADVEPGNLLALEQVLLVTGRDVVQAFYSWEQIERDIARRRQENPHDAEVLLEAGEIYRLGGALERARETFETALAIARGQDDDLESVRRAERGLYLTWRQVAAGLEREAPEAAREALARALGWARTPRERVTARIRLDQLLEGMSTARVENLERLADEAEDVEAIFDGPAGPAVPARAMALLQLARVHHEGGQPGRAIAALQRMLRETPDAMLGDEPARERARREIDALIEIWGPRAYADQEARARALLEAARAGGDDAALGRILREYPNASVIPEALLERGAALLAAGRPAEAEQALRALLRGHPENERAPKAAALLAEAQTMARRRGAARYTLSWLAARHPEASFTIDGRRWTGAAFAADRRAPARDAGLPPPPAEPGPLREVHFEPVDEDLFGRMVPVATAPGEEAPIALLGDGRSLTAFDLARPGVAWRDAPGSSVNRTWYAEGTLVLALTGALRGVDAFTGQQLWEVDFEGWVVTDLQGADGQAFALLQNAGGLSSERRLLAVDALAGRRVWETSLGTTDCRAVTPHRGRLLVRQSRYEDGRVWPALLVLDGISGRLERRIDLPPQGRMDQEPLPADDRLVVAARDLEGQRQLIAYDVATGATAWVQDLLGSARTCSVLRDGDHAVVLQADGYLSTWRIDDGTRVEQTQIYVGPDAQACPWYGTDAVLVDGRIVLLPVTREPPYVLGAWDHVTGKLAWQSRWDLPTRPDRAAVGRSGRTLLALVAYRRTGAPARVILRVVDANDGSLVQEIESLGLTAEQGMLGLAHGWGSAVVFGRSGAALYTAR